MFVSEAWEKYKSDKKIEGYAPLTLKMYGFQCNLLKRYFGNIEMGDFTIVNLISGGSWRTLKSLRLGHRV